MSGTYIALLRGINVGGKNKLPMEALAALFGAAGCTDVRTVIQSGNVVFAAGSGVAARVPALVSAAIAQRFGYRVPVVMRTAEEWRAVVADNPFLAAGADPARLHVAFLAQAPTAARVAALDPGRSPPDAFDARGREVYLHLPHGTARSKFSNEYLDRTLATTSTVRNWNTVLKLLALTSGP